VDTGLLKKIGRTKKTVIMSTGMASEEEIREAVETLSNAGCSGIILLKCTSSYPAEPKDVNLCTISDMAEKFGCPSGLSDHTLGIAVPVAAVALGACLIEKHFTLSRAGDGVDSGFSLEPGEFSDMVNAVRTAEQAVGKVCYGEMEVDKKNRAYRRSLFVVKDIKKGEAFTSENVRSIRPGYGLMPRELDNILGKTASKDIVRGTPLSTSHF
jgi:pseudaminic acid synthase